MNILARPSKIDPPVTTSVPEPPPVAAPRPQEQRPTVSSRPQVAPSVIGAALTVTGRLESKGDLQIDGKVDGDICGRGVMIGSTAVIKGTIIGEVVELAGRLEGKIEATSASLAKTAHLSGDIIHQSLKIDQGAYFNGTSRPHTKAEKPARAVEAVALPKLIPTVSNA